MLTEAGHAHYDVRILGSKCLKKTIKCMISNFSELIIDQWIATESVQAAFVQAFYCLIASLPGSWVCSVSVANSTVGAAEIAHGIIVVGRETSSFLYFPCHKKLLAVPPRAFRKHYLI